MPSLKPISRIELIRILRLAGFEGPYSGGKHQFMRKGTLKLTIPNPHQDSLDVALLGRLLKQAQIDRDTWQNLLKK